MSNWITHLDCEHSETIDIKYLFSSLDFKMGIPAKYFPLNCLTHHYFFTVGLRKKVNRPLSIFNFLTNNYQTEICVGDITNIFGSLTLYVLLRNLMLRLNVREYATV